MTTGAKDVAKTKATAAAQAAKQTKESFKTHTSTRDNRIDLVKEIGGEAGKMVVDKLLGMTGLDYSKIFIKRAPVF